MLPIAWGGSPQDWAIVVVIILVLFGVKKLPEIGKSLAEGIHEFKKAARKASEEDEEDAKPD
jgi:sec-independent protein translocase protein TatA